MAAFGSAPSAPALEEFAKGLEIVDEGYSVSWQREGWHAAEIPD